MRPFSLLALALALPLAQACSSQVAGTSGTGNTGDTDGTSGTSSPGTVTGQGGGGGGAAPTAPPCSAAEPCAAGFFCHYEDFLCGKGETTGICIEAQSCDAGSAQGQGCGCDGTLGPNCDDQVGSGASAVDLGPLSACTQPAGTFVCGGSLLCDLSTEYCLISNPDGCGDVAACNPIPSQCLSAPTCDCLGQAGLFILPCMGDASTGITGTGIQGDSPQCP